MLFLDSPLPLLSLYNTHKYIVTLNQCPRSPGLNYPLWNLLFSFEDAHNLDMSSLYLQSQFLPVYWLSCTLKWDAVWTMNYIFNHLMKTYPESLCLQMRTNSLVPRGNDKRKNYICWHYMVIPDHSSQLCCTKGVA